MQIRRAVVERRHPRALPGRASGGRSAEAGEKLVGWFPRTSFATAPVDAVVSLSTIVLSR